MELALLFSITVGVLATIFATTNIVYFIIANWEGLKWYWFSKKEEYDRKD
jgi:hypothetical protein